jgi:hypothetical protein
MKRIVIAFAAGISIFGLAHAQISLPGAADSPPSDPSAKPEAHKKARKPAPIKATPIAPPSLESIIDHPLFQNGVDGQLIFSLRDKILRIEKFTLSGEVISDAKQKCRIDIVSEGPIQVKTLGAPDGMDRYSAEIPACPLTFDVLDGAVVAPPQTTACVFQAADCQASPSGVWGPEAASLEKDAKAIEKSRSRADASIVESLRLIKARDKRASASLVREQTEFASRRDDACRDYAGEARHGFCAARMTEARAALLRTRALDATR